MNATLIELSNGFAEAVENVGRNVVSINEGGRAGVSGTVWRYIVEGIPGGGVGADERNASPNRMELADI